MPANISVVFLPALFMLGANPTADIHSIRDMDRAATAGILAKTAVFKIHATALETTEGWYLTDDPCGTACGYVVGFDVSDAIKDRPEAKLLYRNLGLGNKMASTLHVIVSIEPTHWVKKKMFDGSTSTFVTDVVVTSIDRQVLKP